MVRINALDSGLCQQDLEEIVPQGPTALMLPKTTSAQQIQQLDAAVSLAEQSHGMPLGKVQFIPLWRPLGRGKRLLHRRCQQPDPGGLFLGGEDLTADLRCKRTKEGKEIDYARQRVVCAARAAGVEAFDTPFTDVNDDGGLWEDARYAKSLGFTGKASISPPCPRHQRRFLPPTG